MEQEEAGSGEVAHGSGSECAAADNIATQPQGGHGAGQSVSLSWGQGRLQRDGYNVRGYFMAETKEALLAGQRDVAS